MSSSQSICYDVYREHNVPKPTNMKTPREIIFGWDRFNSTCFGLLILSFIVWCIAYFASYTPLPVDDHGGHHEMGNH